MFHEEKYQDKTGFMKEKLYVQGVSGRVIKSTKSFTRKN